MHATWSIVTALGVSLALGLAAGAAAEPMRPDTFLARVEALASLQTLNAEILAARSATRTLEAWCALHKMAAQPTLRAEVLHDGDRPIEAAQRARLAIGPDEPVRYRHVRLACGDHVLSEAENWYVPARLTAAMNASLEGSDTPFGKVVAPLEPTRQTIAATVLWPVLPPDWEAAAPLPDHPDRALAIPAILFEHHAVLYDKERRPIAEVAEHYTREILAFGRR